MIQVSRYTGQKGYTLIELLLYITILGSLLMGISMYFVTSTSSRVKNQTVSEVDRQGALALDYITQTIRNASSITSPAAGATDDRLTLAVPNVSLSPTVFDLSGGGGGGSVAMGNATDGSFDGDSQGGRLNATKFVAGASGTVSALNARLGVVAPSPNNQGQMAIYSGPANPDTLLANSATVNMASDGWNTFPIPTVNITSGQTYWLVYNTNYSSSIYNNVRINFGSSGQFMSQPQTYGNWPSPWFGISQDVEFSVYTEISTGGGGGDPLLQVTEAAGQPVPLTNDKVTISNLSFKNLSRPGTPGVVQVSITISRLNPNNRNEYDYQKTFISTAALRP